MFLDTCRDIDQYCAARCNGLITGCLCHIVIEGDVFKCPGSGFDNHCAAMCLTVLLSFGNTVPVKTAAGHMCIRFAVCIDCTAGTCCRVIDEVDVSQCDIGCRKVRCISLIFCDMSPEPNGPSIFFKLRIGDCNSLRSGKLHGITGFPVRERTI